MSHCRGRVSFPPPNSFLLQLRIPIDHHYECRPWLPRCIQVDEALSVRARVIHRATGSRCFCIKKGAHFADLHTRARCLYLRSHQNVVLREVENLLSVPPPARLGAATRGNLPLASWAGKGHYIYFHPPGFRRTVRHPFPVWRE